MTEEELLHATTYRDRVSTVTDKGKRNWIYALKPKGKWYTYRKIIAYFYLAIFFIMPFIKVNGLPFMMVNLPKGKFILFSKIFWPQDFFIFAIGMITFIIFIVLFTVAFGRLFCGWVCPQTIFMEFVFRPIEWLIEGSPSQQKKLNASGDTMQKTGKKILKHVIFFLVSFIIAHTFLSYILGVDEVIKIIKEPITQNIGLLFGLIIFTFLFYAVYAYVREIVCTTICPYGRLQGVMVDKNTMGVSYDYQRGEPRGLFKKNTNREFGDCISCNQCVHVCPTGIDIRNGSQMECVGCTACIDACSSVMDTMRFDRGLIRYASENEISSSSKFVFTTRMKAYTVLLGVLLVAMSFMIASRKTVDTYISRAGGQLYQEMPNGNISNLFEAKIINKTKQEMPVTFTLEGIEGTVKLVGENKINLKAEDVTKCSFFIEIPKEKIPKHSSKITIGVFSNDTKIQTLKIKFLGPFH